jgi:uncharacterized protein (DUF2235 family)
MLMKESYELKFHFKGVFQGVNVIYIHFLQLIKVEPKGVVVDSTSFMFVLYML